MKACRGRIKAYLGLLLLFTVGVIGTASGEVRVIAIGAHPDDCDLGAGGTAQLLEAMGIKVKFVSITNGDAGNPTQGGGAGERKPSRQEGVSEWRSTKCSIIMTAN